MDANAGSIILILLRIHTIYMHMSDSSLKWSKFIIK